MNQSLPVIDEAADAFYQTFADYLQLVMEAYELPESIFNGTSLEHLGADQPTWTQIRQRQVQDWKHHYSLESRAIQRLRAMQREHGQELAVVTEFYASKRELIWQAHQHELAKLGAFS